MALALLRLEAADDSRITFTVDTGTSTHFRLHLGKEVRREDGIDLLDGPYWSSPLHLNPAAGRHLDTRTTFELAAEQVREPGTLAQLESCRGPDGRGPAWSRPVRLPVAVPLRSPHPLLDAGPRARARRRVMSMSATSGSGLSSGLSSGLGSGAAPAGSPVHPRVPPPARPRTVPVRSARERFSRPASIADLIGTVVQAAAPVVLDALAHATPAAPGGGASTGSAGGGGAADPAARLLADILRTVLGSLAHAAGTAPAAAPVSAPGAGAPATVGPTPGAGGTTVATTASLPAGGGNRFLAAAYARPMIFGVDDALIAAVAGPVLSSVVGPLVQALPQLLNAANAQKLARQAETDRHVSDLLSEVNRSLLLQQLVAARDQSGSSPAAPGVQDADLAAIGALLQPAATAAAPAGTPAAGGPAAGGPAAGAPARTASLPDPRRQPIASRAALTAVTGPAVTVLGAPRVAFAAGQAITLRYRLDVGAAGPSTALPRAILTVCVREPGGASDLCTTTARLTEVAPGQELKVVLTPEECQALPVDTDLEVLATMRWRGARGTYQATGTQRVLVATRTQVRDRGGVVGSPLELTDMARFRGFWNQVWGSPGAGPAGDAMPMWGLDVALRYSVVAVPGEHGNGLMEARLQQAPPGPGEGLRVRTRGRLKSGLEVSVHELNKLLALWPGEQPLPEADLGAFLARGWLAGQGGDAVTQVRVEGRRGTRGVLWVVPVLRLREVTLATVAEVDPYGQVVSTQDRTVRFPVVESIRVLALSSRGGGRPEDAGDLADLGDPAEANGAAGAQEAAGLPAAYRFDGYDVVLSSLVGLEPAVPLPRTGR